MNAQEARKQVQRILGVADDGIFGPRTLAAFNALGGASGEWPPSHDVQRGKASSFADPADVAAFRRCKAQGKSDQECFKVGDNGVGRWGDDTTKGNGPMCALPPEDWQQFGTMARGKKVLVKANGNQVICELRDTMPHKANIKNGAIIDLNPDAAKALGLRPPFMVDVEWSWV